jgi:8-oxo-dGTP pyrophosphatase MutT (NUDIX family)
MAHIHTQPNQHDMTVSAYVVRVADEPLCMVHMHKKIDKLMQIGGHIELSETPWQAVQHELEEESGYQLDQLYVLQPFSDVLSAKDAVIHPVPFASNTHDVGNGHYHSDLCYGFIAENKPSGVLAANESEDIRWVSLSELKLLAKSGEALGDIVDIYAYLIDHLDEFARIPAKSFSTAKPTRGITYKR